MTCLSPQRFQACRALAALALLLCFAAAASAQTNPFGDFTINICETELCLLNPEAAAKMSYTDRSLMIFRDSPYIQLRNDSNSAAPITEFRLTIGDSRFNFSEQVLLGSKTPGYSLTSSTVGGLGNELVVNIGNGGLAKGNAIHLKIDLGVDPAFQSLIQPGKRPDYRDVFGDGSESIAKATFDPATGDNFTKQKTYEFSEVVVPGRNRSGLDPVYRYAGVTTVGSVPEPTSLLLFVGGLLGGMTVCVRTRRVPKAA